MNFLPKAKPKVFYDIVVQVAIIRPGPIVGKLLAAYLKRRQGLEPIDYMHPLLEPILKRTLGVPLFQEQLLRMAMTVAGFSGGEAEELRRALGFKRANKRLEKIEARLRSGMTEKGIDQETQDRIAHSIIVFAHYGFPESHAASFALLTYASAYLKVHYLAEFTTAMLNNYPLGFYAPATLVKDAQRHGLHFNAIDINRSQYLFTIEKEGLNQDANLRLDNHEKFVRVGLRYVKGLRATTAEKIVVEREKGFYTGIEDLLRRVPELRKNEIRGLSLSGALNFSMTVHRRQALWGVELALQPRGELFEALPESIAPTPAIKQMNPLQLVETDLKTNSLTIGRHPMSFIREELNSRGILTAAQTLKLNSKRCCNGCGVGHRSPASRNGQRSSIHHP